MYIEEDTFICIIKQHRQVQKFRIKKVLYKFYPGCRT